MTLPEWQKTRLETVHANRRDYPAGPAALTVLTYCWGMDAERPTTQFYRVESAFRETWLRCGMMKSVIVTDRPTDEMKTFAAQFPSVEIQVEPSLVPGDLHSMSVDCDGRLVERFDTPYVMIVQDDGFPLRSGVEEFLGRWDFIGAPYVRDLFLPRLAARILNHWTMNGGFSIRSHGICELAAMHWKREFHACDNRQALVDDIYYTSTLIRRCAAYRREMRLADNRTALRFSWDCAVPFSVSSLPFGFHRAATFERLIAAGNRLDGFDVL